MAELRLYRNIYRINYNLSGQTYTLVNADDINANIINLSNSNTVESPSVQLESTGVYYVSLNPSLYSYDNFYEVQYSVRYTVLAPIKILKTKFRFMPYNISSDYSIDLGNFENKIHYELENSDKIIVEVININN